MKFVILVFLFFTACSTSKDKERISELQKENQVLQDQVKTSERHNLDLQAQCSKAADQAKAGDLGKLSETANVTYTNHYNTKLNKCFVSIFSSDAAPKSKGLMLSTTIADILENKVYAEVYQRSGEPPFLCRLTNPDGSFKDCHTMDEFKSLTTGFMID